MASPTNDRYNLGDGLPEGRLNATEQVEPTVQVVAGEVQKPAQRRSLLVDIVRGLAISLVCIGHTDQGMENRSWWGTSRVGYNLDQFIYAFHMPAFFFVSGVFLTASVAKRGPVRFINSKIAQLMYPYLIWSVIQDILKYPFHRFMDQPIPTVPQFLYGLLTGDTLWFLPAVFLCFLFGRLARNWNKPLLFSVAVALSLVTYNVNASVVPSTLYHFPFLVAGMWVGRGFEKLERLPLPLAAAGVVVLGGLVFSVTRGPYVHSRWMAVPLGLTGTAMLFLVARCCRKDSFARTMAWVGEASFGVYLMSPYGQGFGRELLVKALHSTEPYLQLVIPSLFAIFVPALIYQYRVRLKLDWLFLWPFKGRAAAE